jgi:hypothetical protein
MVTFAHLEKYILKMKVMQVRGEEAKKSSFRRTAMHKWIVATRKAVGKKARQLVEVAKTKERMSVRKSEGHFGTESRNSVDKPASYNTQKKDNGTQFET